MSQWLKAGTAVTIVVGPFVDSTDGYTPVTGLASADFDEYGLVKHGLDTDIDLATSDTFAAIPDLDGYYTQLLSASHVDTPGMLSFIANDDSAFLPVVKNLMVVAAVPYDALIADTDRLPAHVQEFDAGLLHDLDSSDIQAELVTYDAATGTEVAALNDIASSDVQAELVTYDAPTKAELDSGFAALNDLDSSDIQAELVTYDAATGTEIGNLNDPTAAAVADAVWNELSTDHVGAGSFGLNLDAQVSAVTASVSTDDMAGIADHVWDELSTDHTGAGSYGLNLDDQITGVTASVSSDDMAGIADHVWDELSTDHTDAGSFGLNLDDQISGVSATVDSDDMAGIADHVWDELTTDHAAANTFGANLDAKVSAAGSITSSDVWAFATRELTADPFTSDNAALIADHTWNELSTDHVGAGSFGLVVDKQLSSLNDIDSSDVAAELITYDAATGTELAALNDIASSDVAAELLTYDAPTKAELDSGFAGLNDIASSDVNAEVVDVLRTDTIPDSYAADGAHPTIAQAILAIQQYLQERAVSGTTVTVKKPDGSTTAMTFTLDSDTAPTSITRAT